MVPAPSPPSANGPDQTVPASVCPVGDVTASLPQPATKLQDTVRAAARRPDSESRCYECVSSNPRTLASEAKR